MSLQLRPGRSSRPGTWNRRAWNGPVAIVFPGFRVFGFGVLMLGSIARLCLVTAFLFEIHESLYGLMLLADVTVEVEVIKGE